MWILLALQWLLTTSKLMSKIRNAYASRKREERNVAMAMRRQRQKNNSGSQTCICDLPNPIISDILSRLPVNTVAHSMCVRKSWRDLVLDPHFAKLHLARSSKSVSLLFPYPSDFISGRNPMYVVDEQINGGRFYFQKSILGRFKVCNFPLRIFNIMCSCDGMLLCVCCMLGTIYICNPITVEWIQIPRPKVEPSPNHFKSANYGFGFCNRSNQYKVIRFVTTGIANPSDSNCVARCEIFLLGSKEWRCIGDSPFDQYCRNLSIGESASPWIPLNGSLHLLVKAKGDQSHGVFFISCFKIYEEELTMLAPVPVLHDSYSTFTLEVLQNHLVLFNASRRYSRIEMWVMNDYGVNESWTKNWVIERDVLKGLRPANWFKPVKFTEDGKSLVSYSAQSFANRTALISYDTESGRITKHKFDNIQYYLRINYVPSFLSPTDFARKHDNSREGGYEPPESI